MALMSNSWNISLLQTVSLSSNADQQVGKVPKEMTPEWSRRLSAPNRGFKWNTACLGKYYKQVQNTSKRGVEKPTAKGTTGSL
jgi:hypothetical protein